MKLQLALVAGLFFLLTADPSLAAKPQVSISTNRSFISFVGRTANVILIVRMEVHEGNRRLKVSCDGIDGGVFVSTSRDFSQGKGQAKIYDIGFLLTPATYRCEAVLSRKAEEDGKTKEFTSFVEVIVH